MYKLLILYIKFTILLQVYKINEHKVKQTLCTLHKGHKGMSKTCAQTMFVQEAGPVHKSHLYRLRLNKSQPKQTQGSALSICNSVWLAICTNGVQLFHVSLIEKSIINDIYQYECIVYFTDIYNARRN